MRLHVKRWYYYKLLSGKFFECVIWTTHPQNQSKRFRPPVASLRYDISCWLKAAWRGKGFLVLHVQSITELDAEKLRIWRNAVCWLAFSDLFSYFSFFNFYFSIQLFTLPSLLPIPSLFPTPPPPSPSLLERGLGILPRGKPKALPPTSRPRELCIHID